MKALLTAVGVSVVFALFFVLFLVVPALVILVAYVGMTWHHKRLTRRAKAARAAQLVIAPAEDGVPA